jgi:hypothetical protein
MNYQNLPALCVASHSGGVSWAWCKMLAKTSGRVSDYLDAIERLAPVIAEHRAAFDSQRQLPDAVFNALADAGLFRLWLPEALGGPELSPDDFMNVVRPRPRSTVRSGGLSAMAAA